MNDQCEYPSEGPATRHMSEQCQWGKLEVPRPTPFDLEQRRGALRVVLFGSAVRGQMVLERLAQASRNNPDKIAITGVCTDEVFGGKVSRKRRLYRYNERSDNTFLQRYMEESVQRFGLPLFSGSVKSPYFQEEVLDEHWKPDVIVMATFGQLVPPEVFQRPRYGMYNLHPSDLSRDKHPGPNPFQSIMDADESTTRMSLHHVDSGFDTGHVVGVSPEIYLKREDGSYPRNLRMHEQTGKAAGRMAEVLVNEIAEQRQRIEALDFGPAFTDEERAAFMQPLNDRLEDHIPLHLRHYLHKNGTTEIL